MGGRGVRELQTSFLPGCGRGCRARGRGGSGREGEGAHGPGARSEEARGEGCGGGAPGGREQVTSGAGGGGTSGPPRAVAGGGLGQEGLSESPPPAVPRAWGRDGSSSAGVAARGDASPASTRALGRGAWKWSRSGGLMSPLCLQNASSVRLLDFLVGGRGLRASSSLCAADLRAAISPPLHFTLKRIYPIAVETCGECGFAGAWCIWWPVSLKLTVRSSAPQKRPNAPSGVAGMPAGGTARATKMLLNLKSRGHLPSFLVCPSESKNSLWGLARLDWVG